MMSPINYWINVRFFRKWFYFSTLKKKTSFVLRKLFGQCSVRTQFFLNPSTLILDCSENPTAGFLTDELLYFTQHKAMFAPQLLLSSRIMGPCQLQQPVLTTTFWFFQMILFSDFFFSFDILLGKKQRQKTLPIATWSHVASCSIRSQLIYQNNFQILIPRVS